MEENYVNDMDENEGKKITAWKLTKWFFMFCSIVVYALVFARLFVSCDSKISDEIILTSEEYKDYENLDLDYLVFHYQPVSWTNEDGTIQIKNIVYLDPISELQLTVRYRLSTYGEEPFFYKVRLVEGEEERVYDVEIHSETRFDYKYQRLCVPDIKIDGGKTEEKRVQIVDENGEVSYETKSEIIGGNKAYLDIYNADTGELEYTFALAGKGVGGARVRRNKFDVRIID